MKQRIAVIGAHSFSGITFIQRLVEQGHKVLGFSRRSRVSSCFIPSSLRETKNLEGLEVKVANLLHDHSYIAKSIMDNGIDTVVNFAAQSMVAESWKKPEDWYDVNVASLAKLITLLANSGTSQIKKFIQFTTPEVYGSTRGLIEENWNFNPTTPYAISRAASDFHLRAMLNSFGFPVIFTRTANIYGKHQQLYRLMPKLVIKVLKGERLELHGNGESVRSFIHSSDVARALELIMLKGEIGETYHISGKEFTSILDLTTKVLTVLEKDPSQSLEITQERAGKDQAYLLDSRKIRSELGWSEEVTLEDGIREVIDWINSEWESIRVLSTEYEHAK